MWWAVFLLRSVFVWLMLVRLVLPGLVLALVRCVLVRVIVSHASDRMCHMSAPEVRSHALLVKCACVVVLLVIEPACSREFMGAY